MLNWNNAIEKLHNSEDSKNNQSKSYRRIAFDEICANFLSLSENRKRIRKRKKAKIFDNQKVEYLIKKLPFKLTKSQKTVLKEIDQDLLSNKRMFRIIQGDVGSGKTIVSLLSIYNVTQSGYQTALMSPTEILSKQHFELSKKIFGNLLKIRFLTGKTEYKERKNILKELKEGKIDLIIGTHSLFQKTIKFRNLGLTVIDEQHKLV